MQHIVRARSYLLSHTAHCQRHTVSGLQVRNFKAGLQLFERVGEVAEAEGHHPDLHLQGYNQVYAVMSTHSVGAAPGLHCTKCNQLHAWRDRASSFVRWLTRCFACHQVG